MGKGNAISYGTGDSPANEQYRANAAEPAGKLFLQDVGVTREFFGIPNYMFPRLLTLVATCRGVVQLWHRRSVSMELSWN